MMSKLVDAVNYMSTWTYMNIKGQGHLLTFVQRHSDSIFYNFFSLPTARPIETKFHVKPPWDRWTKVCSNGPGHMTKMAAMPIYGKNLNNDRIWNQQADDLESWYAALGTHVLPIFSKWRSCPFLRRGQIWPLMFYMGKR